jgi:plasmid stabilization system protein ParE
LKYEIRAAAERDIDEAASWYSENAVDPRVAVRFLLEIRAAFETIADAPQDVVVITAVFHGRRHPLVWKQRR